MTRIQKVFLAYFISQLGNWMFRIAIVFSIFNYSSSYSGVAIVTIFLPIMIGGIAFSPRVDGADSVRSMISLDIVRAALCLLPLLSLDEHYVLLSLCCTAILSLSQPVFASAQAAFIREEISTDNLVFAFRTLSVIDWATYAVGMGAAR